LTERHFSQSNTVFSQELYHQETWSVRTALAYRLLQSLQRFYTTWTGTGGNDGHFLLADGYKEDRGTYLKFRFLNEKWTSTIPVVLTLVRKMSCSVGW